MILNTIACNSDDRSITHTINGKEIVTWLSSIIVTQNLSHGCCLSSHNYHLLSHCYFQICINIATCYQHIVWPLGATVLAIQINQIAIFERMTNAASLRKTWKEFLKWCFVQRVGEHLPFLASVTPFEKGDWKTWNAGTTRISRNSIIFVNFITCSLFGSLRYSNLCLPITFLDC